MYVQLSFDALKVVINTIDLGPPTRPSSPAFSLIVERVVVAMGGGDTGESWGWSFRIYPF